MGLSADEVHRTRLAPPGDPTGSEEERLLRDLVDELHDSATLSGETWSRLAARFDASQLVELVVLAGMYHTISFVTNAFGIAREEFGARFPEARAPLQTSAV